MSYSVAFRSTFYGADGVNWRVDILTNQSQRAETFGMDYDRPISIEWVETKKTDAIQPSLLTVRAISSRDRQFMSLLGDWMAKAEVYRNGKLFWIGMIDDAIFEEPYSYAANYVTEISFSDFGPLKRCDFWLEGVQSFQDIIAHCLSKAGLDELQLGQTVSLQIKGQQVSMSNLFVNTDVFRGDGGDNPKCYDVLEQLLEPLGIRIIQDAGGLHMYDIEHLDTHGTETQIVWKGTDAVMGGGESYLDFSINLAPDASDTVIDGNLDGLENHWIETYRYYNDYFEDGIRATGFYLQYGPYFGNQRIVTLNVDEGWFFRMKGVIDPDAVGIARRAYCRDTTTTRLADRMKTTTPVSTDEMDWLFCTDSQFIPLIPNASGFQLRVSLDMVFSILLDPFGGEQMTRGNVSMERWNQMKCIFIPVKLELIGMSGNVLYHYANMMPYDTGMIPISQQYRGWSSGPASWTDMALTYYNYGMEETPLNDGWITNRHTPAFGSTHLSVHDEHRGDGEYIPMPPVGGVLRLTVSNGIMEYVMLPQHMDTYDGSISWQLYRNPTVSVVRNTYGDNGIKNDDVVISDWLGDILGRLSLSQKIGTYNKGMDPSSRCLIFDGYGRAYEEFTKLGRTDSLEELRLRDIEAQYTGLHIVLDGTAEIATGLGPMTDASTNGRFLPVMRNLDPRSGTMQIRMIQMHIEEDRHYHYEWSNHVCAKEEVPYEYEWSNHVCAQEYVPENESETK